MTTRAHMAYRARTAHTLLPVVSVWSIVVLLAAGPATAQAAADTLLPALPPTTPVRPPAAPAQAAGQELEPTLREGLLADLRKGFPTNLPFFGLSLFGVPDTLGARPTPSWENIPITPIYQLGPGDEILVSIWGAFDMDLTLEVNDRGFVTMPGADRVYVNGLTFGELEGELLRALRQGHAQALDQEKFDSGAVQMKVTLGELRGIHVLVTGQVAEPGGYAFGSPAAFLMDALALAGGITSRGGLRAVEVRRGGETRRLDLYELLVGGQVDLSRFLLRQDDIVFVPYRERTVSLSGAVRQPAIFEVAPGEHLDALLRLAGGLTPDADPHRVQIERVEEGLGTVLHDVDLTRLAADRVALRDGDQVRVAETPKPRRRDIVEIVGGGVKNPGTYELSRETAIIDTLLARAGLYDDAVLERCLLIRMQPDYTRQKVELDLAGAMRSGFQLQPEDRLIINSQFQLEGGDKQITLGGHVKEPGQYLLSEGLTLYDILHNYGGFEDPDYQAQTYLQRSDIIRVDKGTGEETILPFNLGDVLARRDDFPLESEDAIIVYPRSRFKDEDYVEISGEVRSPGRYPIEQSMNLGDLLVQAGGATDKADSANVNLSRIDPESRGQRSSALVDLTGDRGLLLKSGDLVYLRRQTQWREPQIVTLTGQFAYPGRYPLEEDNERLSQVIERAGRLTTEAFPEGASYYRTIDGEKRPVAIDIAGLLKGHVREDLPMLGGDSLHVPRFAHTIDIRGEALQPQLVHYIPGKSVGYYIKAAGGGTAKADLRATGIRRANGLMMDAYRRLWFDPEVPPGSTILVPARPEGASQPVWRHPYVVGVIGGLASGLGVYIATR